MPVLIAVIAVVIVAILVAFASGIVRFQRRQRTPSAQDAPLSSPFQGEGETAPQAEGEPEELVDLVDYFSDYEGERDAPPAPPRFTEAEEHFDRLCNLKMGRGYLADAQNYLAHAAQSEQPLALLYFDFNRFRFLNTLRGFSTGDYALTRIAQETALILPEGAMVTRLSADHFAALIIYIDENQLQDLNEQFKRAAERIRGDVGAKSGLQIAMGVALTHSPADYDIFKLIRRANIARHCLKLTKTESYLLFDSTMLSSYLYGESALDDYSEHQYADDFTLYLRPQLLLSSKRITSCDSMARWAYEDANDSAPIVDGGCLPGSNLKVAHLICRTVSRWRKAGHIPLPVMISLNEIDFYKNDLDAFFVRCLGEFQLEPHLITLSFSLHALRLEPELANAQLQKLAAVGLRLAISDIDRGTNSLELPEAKVDYLKLYKGFAHQLDKQPLADQEIIQAIAMARGTGAGTIFEGVDTALSVTRLTELGATMVQGKYVGRASNVETFTGEMSGFMRAAADPNATVILDDESILRGNYNI